MDNERVADQEEVAAETPTDEEEEYDLEGLDTDNLDDAMREALEAVERSQDHIYEVAAESKSRATGEDGAAAEGELAELQAELAELRDRSIRTLADFDNYRKRVARERHDERRYAVTELAQDILAVVDNLERALDSEGGLEDLKQGVGMIHRQLQTTLGRHGVQRVAALGEPFDPALHEAVARVEDQDVAEPMVREELQSGYTLYDRLLRPSMVRVAVPTTEQPGAEESEES